MHLLFSCKRGIVLKNHIVEIIKQIELEYDVKVLYACEAGSRTWGVTSEESDYDVRFIYLHKTEWYLSIDQKRDVLEVPKHDRISIPVNPLVDMSGWELTKSLRLLRKSNPGLLEWMHSGIIYSQATNFIESMYQLEDVTFSPIPCIYHYVKMAKGNFKRIEEKGPDVKTYLNVIRPLLMAEYIAKHGRMSSLDLKVLVDELLPSNEIKTKIENIIFLKSSGQKSYQQSLDLSDFLKTKIEKLEEYVATLENRCPDPTNRLDQFFRMTLAEVWGK